MGLATLSTHRLLTFGGSRKGRMLVDMLQWARIATKRENGHPQQHTFYLCEGAIVFAIDA